MLEWKNGKELTKFYNSNNVYNYYYNDNGVRTRKVVNNVNTYYYFEDADIFMEKNDNYTLYFIREFDGNLLGFEYNDNTYYYIKDVFDSIIGIIDSNYNIIVEYKYDTWGNIIGVFDENGNDISNNPNHIGNLNPYRYRGYYYDRETNLYYLGYRYYSPTHHRFISTDCATYDDIVGGNLYVYCNNNPVIKVDDNGKVPFAAIVIVGGILNAGKYVISNAVNKKKISAKETIFHLATGAVGAAIGVINPLLGLSLTSLADSSYIVAKDRIERYKKQKNKQNKITFKRRAIETAEDIGKILQSLVTDVITNKCASKVVNNTIPKSRGREAKYFMSQFLYKKAQNFYMREGLGSLIETGVSSLADRIIENCEKYPVSNKIIDINSPLYQPYDNRFYIVNTEE